MPMFKGGCSDDTQIFPKIDNISLIVCGRTLRMQGGCGVQRVHPRAAKSIDRFSVCKVASFENEDILYFDISVKTQRVKTLKCRSAKADTRLARQCCCYYSFWKLRVA